ncbi:hypothetical protein CC85DRAFT_138918 [Cutaneotrichosporon oleaginosum]|uniref:Hyaluronan/mRNA-binding protein domain-containing protein n=1 Tax=Cutaneotrichosporon oleaginosum TaxID=879819 RepID=A0A0J0XIC0_9TREE|nr:uncharacterized protein CC85DRAFT_138918 [Cutaneotrichosporon oleaginosum]KLT40846.1 hypothetical protein CC85DRAFT_138918 [Cutaneotrichosporon oleaginosum]TXT09294.1 hypothetical protein COLE_03228 [Cutaneotrichosporon oleaginosum]
MSVVSKNPFELLDDGEDRAPSPAPKGAAKVAPTAKQPKVVPGAAQKGGRGARAPTAPRATYAAGGGDDGFEGERVAPPKKDHQGRDRHTKGPREDRSHTGPRSRAPGAAGARGPKGGNRGGRGGAAGAAGAEKKTGAAPAENWTNEEGKAELSAETQGEKDVAEEGAETPAPAQEEAQEEDNSKTLDQYLAERANAALGGQLAKKEARQVSDDVEGKQFEREELENFFGGSKASKEKKERAPKKEKIRIEVDGQFAQPARPPRGDRPERGAARGGRGGNRGRGAPRGGAARAPRQAPANVADESAFPALGA